MEVRNKKLRDPNMELLRIIAMLMVVIWHFFYHGVVNEQIQNSESQISSYWAVLNYILSQFAIAVCSTCVNVFVLLTGYFMIGKGFKSIRLLKIWFQTFFYGVIISTLFYFLSEPESRSLIRYSIIHAAFPYTCGVYWFVHDYLALMIIAPLLGAAAMKMTKQLFDKLMIVIVILGVSFISVEPYGNDLGFYYGHSFIWFMCLFMSGCYLRRFELPFKKYHRFCVFFLISFVVSILTVFIVGIYYLFRDGFLGNVCYVYNGFSFLTALLFFSIFKKVKIKKASWVKTILWIAPLTFGVYLIHDNPFIREWFWSKLDLFPIFIGPFFVFYLFVVPISVFIVCIFIDYIRTLLFRVFRIDDGINMLSNIIDKKIHSVMILKIEHKDTSLS